MPTERSYFSKVSKGAETRQRIIDRAFRLASRDGLSGVTLGVLAEDLGLSKSGLFAHFDSKEALQVEILRAAAQRFEEQVMLQAFRAPRGVPRIRRVFDRWMRWLNDPESPGGCIFIAAAAELDDREGRPRDFLVGAQKQLLATLARSARLAIEAGHFAPDVDCDQFAFELDAILFAYNHARRLMRDPHAETRARRAFERLLACSAARS